MVKAGKPRPHFIQTNCTFFTACSGSLVSSFPRLVIPTFSPWFLFACCLAAGPRASARALATRWPTARLFWCFFVFLFFSFSLPVIAQTQEMKLARKEIRQCGSFPLLMLSRLQDAAWKQV